MTVDGELVLPLELPGNRKNAENEPLVPVFVFPDHPDDILLTGAGAGAESHDWGDISTPKDSVGAVL
jgi:hypothetical protein